MEKAGCMGYIFEKSKEIRWFELNIALISAFWKVVHTKFPSGDSIETEALCKIQNNNMEIYFDVISIVEKTIIHF